MTEQGQWPLEKIRQAYKDILSAWNIIFPPFPGADGRGEETVPDSVDIEEETFWGTMGTLRKAHHELKKEADASGNPKVWTAEEYSQKFLESLIGQR